MISSSPRSQKSAYHLSCTAADVAAALNDCENDRLGQGLDPDRQNMDQCRIKADKTFWEEDFEEFFLRNVPNKAHPEKLYCAVVDLPTVRGGFNVAPVTKRGMLQRALLCLCSFELSSTAV